MDKQTQDQLWNELGEETKQEYREKYKFHLANSKREMKCNDGGYDLTVLRSNTIVDELVNMFGFHNLNPEPPTPKTWEDVVKENEVIRNIYKELEFHIHKDLPYKEHDLIRRKMLATYQIQQLIDLGYEGMVTEEEWEDEHVPKYCIFCKPNGTLYVCSITHINKLDKTFIAFHHRDEAEEFMSYESNRNLVKMYHLM